MERVYKIEREGKIHFLASTQTLQIGTLVRYGRGALWIVVADCGERTLRAVR